MYAIEEQTYGYYLSYFWANDKLTRDALGINKGTVDEWVRCHSGDVPYSRDLKSSIKYHRNVTANGYRALVYRSVNGYIVSWHICTPLVDGSSIGVGVTDDGVEYGR